MKKMMKWKILIEWVMKMNNNNNEIMIIMWKQWT